jgi:hypothetical protein
MMQVTPTEIGFPRLMKGVHFVVSHQLVLQENSGSIMSKRRVEDKGNS